MAHKRSSSHANRRSTPANSATPQPASPNGSAPNGPAPQASSAAASGSPRTPANTSRANASLTPKQRAVLATRTTSTRPTVRPDAPLAPTRSAGAARRRTRQRFSIGSNPWLFGGTLLAVLAIAIFAIIHGSNASANSSPGQLNNSNVPLVAGKAAPNFTLTGADGKQYSLSQYRGKVVLLEFFAPWCPHCRNETTVLNQVASTDAGQGVQVLSVSASPYGYNYEATGDTSPITMNDITKFVNTFNVTYPAMLDTSLKAGNAYGVVGYPQMFLVDRNGDIAWNNGTTGEVAYTQLQSVIQQTLLIPQTTPAASPTATHTATPAK